jgi:hypothetical protein
LNLKDAFISLIAEGEAGATKLVLLGWNNKTCFVKLRKANTERQNSFCQVALKSNLQTTN